MLGLPGPSLRRFCRAIRALRTLMFHKFGSVRAALPANIR
jgi:hypothetical protein